MSNNTLEQKLTKLEEFAQEERKKAKNHMVEITRGTIFRELGYKNQKTIDNDLDAALKVGILFETTPPGKRRRFVYYGERMSPEHAFALRMLLMGEEVPAEERIRLHDYLVSRRLLARWHSNDKRQRRFRRGLVGANKPPYPDRRVYCDIMEEFRYVKRKEVKKKRKKRIKSG